jgi:hypothetical protein
MSQATLIPQSCISSKLKILFRLSSFLSVFDMTAVGVEVLVVFIVVLDDETDDLRFDLRVDDEGLPQSDISSKCKILVGLKFLSVIFIRNDTRLSLLSSLRDDSVTAVDSL